MSDRMPQNFANHTRYVPMFHFVLAAILLGYAAWTVRHIIKWPSPQHAVDLAMAFAFLLMFLFMRGFAIKVQDRVIRLEERLRMERLFPPDLKSRIEEFTPDQFISLRFASDAEFADLARKVLDGRMTNRKEIKKLIQNWRPDYHRA